MLKSTNSLKDLPEDLIIAIEYSLPTDGMALDLMFIGSIGGKEYAFILESKQWDDDYITGSKFSEFRGDDVLLYPQVQVHHHEISFRNYLNIGTRIAKVYPYVYLENATQIGVNKVLQNPDPNSKRIPVITDMNVFINKIIELGLNPGIIGISDLYNAKYFPSKDILTAMSSLIEKEEPFVLTESQEKKVQEIYSAVNSGNKIIHISGPVGSGKNAILLNLFVRLLKKAPERIYSSFCYWWTKYICIQNFVSTNK